MPSSGIQVTDAYERLCLWLKNSNVRPGARLPAERDIAEAIGVTHYAVNRAMNRLILAGRIEREGYKLRFLGESAASPEKSADPFVCDLVVSNRSIFLSTFRRVAKELGIKLNIHRWESSEEAATVLHQLKSPKSQGILFDAPVVPSTDWEPITRELMSCGIPVVCVGQTVNGVTTALSDSTLIARKGISYAAQLGHREFGMIALNTQLKWLPAMRSNWARVCEDRGLLSSQKRVQALDGGPRDLAEFFVREWRDVTCLFMQHDKISADTIVAEFAHLGKRVPRDLSVISMGVAKPQGGSMVTEIHPDTPVIHELCYYWLQKIRRTFQATGAMPPPAIIRVDPVLLVRSSVAPIDGVMPEDIKPFQEEAPPVLQNPWTANQAEFIKTLEMAVQRPYPLALRAREAEFGRVDLAPFVNRPLNFRRGWLGDLPLKYLDAGRHIIHGVPFHVLGGPRRSDYGAVVMQSSVNAVGKAQQLPGKLRIPIESRAKAIYILHGCGFSKHLQQFATYEFFSRKKGLGEIPLVTLGGLPPDLTPEDVERLKDKANIQDWWPDFAQMDFKQGRMVPLLESEGHESVQRHAFLYTLEWINPVPDQKISYLEVSSEAGLATTLGILAISVLP